MNNSNHVSTVDSIKKIGLNDGDTNANNTSHMLGKIDELVWWEIFTHLYVHSVTS
jgi:hypothetical protein